MNHFFSLTPDRVLDAVETSGLLCTGRCMALNSFENRVYDVEIELPVELESDQIPKTSPIRKRIVKFYRPGRWTHEQIQEEHEFLKDFAGSKKFPPLLRSLFQMEKHSISLKVESGTLFFQRSEAEARTNFLTTNFLESDAYWDAFIMWALRKDQNTDFKSLLPVMGLSIWSSCSKAGGSP